MSTSKTQQAGSNAYRQEQTDSSRETSATAGSEVALQATTNERDLNSRSERASKSSESVSIGLTISFTVPIVGRIPNTPSSKNCL